MTPPASKSTPVPAQDEDAEDDYLTMSFDSPKPAKPKTETLTERKKRKALESELRGRPKSKAELAAEEAKKRDEALASSTLEPSNKGFKMMAALGYKPGQALGTGKQAGLLEPVGLEMKSDRGGVGADAEKKRKIREEYEQRGVEEKRQKVDAEGYRERVGIEREERRREGLLLGAMKVAEGLDEGDDNDNVDGAVTIPTVNGEAKSTKRRTKPLGTINVLWRSLARKQRQAERDKRMRHDVQANLLGRPASYNDTELEPDDKLALFTEEEATDLDEDDEELEVFEALDASERLERVVSFLRERWHYCFWCKFRYENEEMDGCPGLTEEDHD